MNRKGFCVRFKVNFGVSGKEVSIQTSPEISVRQVPTASRTQKTNPFTGAKANHEAQQAR